MSILKNENLGFIGIVLAIMLAFFYFILGLSGMMSILGIIIFFVIPSYIILGNFSLEEDERLMIAFFAGVGIFPAVAYWLGIYMSFRISMFITLILLILSGYLAKKLVKKGLH